ncbi:MAG: FAD/NAD(P)-binding protein [Candidatus Dormibacteraeota bacterium]|nr:FAD/NAD(P)-binding protein [Candidatus Dormibacteraeota bacterium]
MALAAEAGSEVRHPLTPLRYRVVGKRRETEDTVTLSLLPLDRPIALTRPGQFNMLTGFGVGEIAISISNDPAAEEPLEHTIRAVGAVSSALCQTPPEGVIGVRGPFGTDWGVAELSQTDTIVVAGGIGLAPLRGAIRALLERRRPSGKGHLLSVVVGARNPSQLLFEEEMLAWQRAGAHLQVTVDTARPGWSGPVGVVTDQLARVPADFSTAVALVCGPEVMIRYTARALVDLGMPRDHIRISLERNMQCGVGLCGHCQLGPWLICRDGPVFTYDLRAEGILASPHR